MPTFRISLVALALAAIAGGCANTQPADSNSEYSNYRNGLRVVLNKPVEIGPNEASTRFQYGRQIARNGAQETDPYCTFELDTVTEKPQSIRPDNFQVTGVQRREQSFSGMPVFPNPTLGGIGRGRGPSQIYYITEFRLRSDNQPTVRSLSCQSDQGAAGIAFPRHLTMAEMSQALGDYFSLIVRN